MLVSMRLFRTSYSNMSDDSALENHGVLASFQNRARFVCLECPGHCSCGIGMEGGNPPCMQFAIC